MTDTANDPAFADVFPRADEARWRELALAALKGAPLERLRSTRGGGLAIEPLYQRLAEDRPRPWRAEPGPWRVCARIDHADPTLARAQLLHDLENGADAIHLVFAGSVGARGFGLPATRAALAEALADVALEARVPIECDLPADGADLVAGLAGLIEARHVDPATYPLNFGLDPLGLMALNGGSDVDWPTAAARIAASIKPLLARGWRGRFVVADGRPVADTGGAPAHEIAFALGSALAMLRVLEAAGVALEDARGMIGFRLSTDADEFISLAKFRALRGLWATIESACGLTPASVHVHAETGWRMMTRRDPWVNLLRTTVATFSAGLGGANAISVLPFTQAIGLPDAFARRLARNTQLVLIEESNLGRVADPAAGAGGFEALTEQLRARAWTHLQEMEASGGLYAALVSGKFQKTVAEARAARAKDVSRRKAPITGVSEFPNIFEAPVTVLAPAPAFEAARAAIAFPPLTPGRDAEPFEALRDAADAKATTPAGRDKVFLANLGPLTAYGARAMFAGNFFGVGGVEAVGESGFEDDVALAAAFAASGASMACLCSSDAIYAERAESAARALATAGARKIWLAGKPSDNEAALRAAGVREFIFAGCDVLAALTSL